MNRYKVNLKNNQSMLLYANSETEIEEIFKHDVDEIESITPYTDKSHEDYIEKIKQKSEFLGKTYPNREVYKCNYYKGYLIIELSKDKTDDIYYDFALYTEYKNERFTDPIFKYTSTPKEVYELINTRESEYIILSRRCYGEPKLSKPKELKGIKSIGSAVFIPKHCKPQIFVKDNDVYIKHTDYFSYTWLPPKGERTDMPTSYYLKKYFNTDKSEKFIYADCWGSIILRNEAWILIKDIIPFIRTEKEIIVARKIVKLQKQDKYTPNLTTGAEVEWERFWENVSKVVKENLDKNNLPIENK